MASQPWIFMAIICVSVLGMCCRVKSSSEADKIHSLPGQPNVGFQQFGGYIFVDDKEQRALFYYFVEAETNPASKPLILWLNGGPGCSSLGIGAFTEHGPFVTNYGEAIVKNKYSWNKEANILYLESPAGVGFSYTTDKSIYRTLNDETTARDNLEFLHRWFAKYSEYKNRDFYIMGESYGGHYVPQLAELIVKTKVNFNLKGISIGNPLLEFETDYNAVDEYQWSHGMISDSAYELLTSFCNNSQFFRQYFRGHLSRKCLAIGDLYGERYSMWNAIDKFNVIGDKCLSYNLTQAAMLTGWLRSAFFQTSASQQLQNDKGMYQELDECNEKNAEMYLNRKDVQRALHARLVGAPTYRLCSLEVRGNYPNANQEIPTINLVGFLVESGLRVIVYSGDQDCRSIDWHSKIG